MVNAQKSSSSKYQQLTAADILLIGEHEPERLYPRDHKEMTQLYRRLASKWHPDHNQDPQAASVFARIKTLKESADKKLANDTWQENGFFTCHLKNGQTFRVRAHAVRPFDLGTMYIAPTTITYVLGRQYEDLFKNTVRQIQSISFVDNNGKPDIKMKALYEARLPTVFKTYEANDSFILTIKKNADDVRLRDLLPFIPKDNFTKHAGWITSRMHEMVRYLDHAGLTHNAITLDNLFVSPAGHSLSLFGGWWYAENYGSALKAVPGEALEFLSSPDHTSHLADGRMDREMIRAAAREMLGDRGGTRLTSMKSIPKPMIDYLRTPSSGDAQQDLHDWYQTVLPKCFGARRFTELKVSYSDVYQPGA